jgi:hypothetical protein
MLRFLRVSIVVVALLAMSATPALAGGHGQAVPIKGTLLGEGAPDPSAPGCTGTPIWRFHGWGTGEMSHLGPVGYTFTHCTYPDFSITPGTFTLVADNGDELVLAHVGVYEVIGAMEGFTGEGTWTAVGGTGRFTHATGSGWWATVGDVPGGDALFGLPDGSMQFTFGGRIAYDASDRSR